MTASPLRPALPGTSMTRTDAHRPDPKRRPAGRARMAAAGVLAFALLATAACNRKEADPQAGSTFGTELTESPGTGATSGSPGASGQPKPSSTGGGQQAPTYPGSAKDYGLAILVAWAAGNKTRIDQLAIQAAALQLTGQKTGNGQWTNVNCVNQNTEQTVCKYYNAHGDEVFVTMQNSQLGHPTAVTEAMIDKTDYASYAPDYVAAFMAAWIAGNKARMIRLSSSSVANFFNGKTPPGGSMSTGVQNGSTWTVTANAPVSDGRSWKFTVNGSKTGGANAITGVS